MIRCVCLSIINGYSVNMQGVKLFLHIALAVADCSIGSGHTGMYYDFYCEKIFYVYLCMNARVPPKVTHLQCFQN